MKHKTLPGTAMGFTIILLSIVLFSSISLLTSAAIDRRSSYVTSVTTIAFQAADSGIERVTKRIYVNDSPTLATSPLNQPLSTGDTTLNNLAANIPGAGCASGVIIGTNGSTPNYSYKVSFFDKDDAPVSCFNNRWRDVTIYVRSEGSFGKASRVLEVGIRPRT